MLLTLALLAAAPAPAPAPAPRVQATSITTAAGCPTRWHGLALRGGMVLDGPPDEKAILKPEDGDEEDDGTSSWPDLRYVYQAGRQVWLGCSYVDDAFIYMPLERPIDLCRYVKRRRIVRLYCS